MRLSWNSLLILQEKSGLEFVRRQLNALYGLTDDEHSVLEEFYSRSRERALNCYASIQVKYFMHNKHSLLNGDLYAIFLYWLSRECNQNVNYTGLAEKVFELNKMAHGVDLFFEVDMPAIFHLGHPLGAVIGRGTIGDYFSFCQGCTVGGNRGVYPRIGERVIMSAGSMILGDSTIGDYVCLGAGAIVKDENVPSFNLVFGHSPNLLIKHIDQDTFEDISPFYKAI